MARAHPTPPAEVHNDELSPGERAIRRDLRALEGQLRQLEDRIPTVPRIAWGVFWGMVLYAVISAAVAAAAVVGVLYFGGRAVDRYIQGQAAPTYLPPLVTPPPPRPAPTGHAGELPRNPDGSIDWAKVQGPKP